MLVYLKHWKPAARRTGVSRLGRHGKVYCLPHETIGDPLGNMVYQSEQAGVSGYGQKGSWQEWRDTVARLARGNSRLIVSLCASLAGPLLYIVKMESHGIHFFGSISTGKSTAAWAAASVYGHPAEGVRTWNATSNALEGAAVLRNDNLLVLDEVGQGVAKDIAQAVYRLFNGQGRGRADRRGGAREPASRRAGLECGAGYSTEEHSMGRRKRLRGI